MKILFYAISLNYGGAERCMTLLASEFKRRGHDVAFMTNESKPNCVYPLEDNISFYCLSLNRLNSIFNIASHIKHIRNVLKVFSPDVIISFFPSTVAFASIAKLGLNIPIIFSERNDPTKNIIDVKNKIFQKAALKCSKHIVFQTFGAQSVYPNCLNKSSIILNPCDTTIFPPFFCGKREPVIVSVGRLQPQKRQDILIKAFAQICTHFPLYKLVIYGEGDLRTKLEQLIKYYHLQDKVFLPGNINNVPTAINSCSIFAFSSDYEGLPNALIEAMVMGLPCISTDFSPGGARELIKNNENGIIVPCGDENQMAQALSFLINNEHIASQLGINARKIINKTSLAHVTTQWLDLLTDVTKQ